MASEKKTSIPHIGNIGEGDANADWIKRVRGGVSNRNELRAHARLAAKHAEENGDALATREAQDRLAALGEEDEDETPARNQNG